MLMPPVSKVSPLPMTQTFFLAPGTLYSNTRNFGGSLLPRATPSSAPMPSFFIAGVSSTFTRSRGRDSFFASLARCVGVHRFDGMFSRSRANAVAAANSAPSARPLANAASSALPRPTAATLQSCAFLAAGFCWRGAS